MRVGLKPLTYWTTQNSEGYTHGDEIRSTATAPPSSLGEAVQLVLQWPRQPQMMIATQGPCLNEGTVLCQ